MAMSDEERSIRQRLKDDFQHYAARCLKVRTKEGALKPFILNAAQLYAHQKVEEQRARTGKVRVVALKGRQQGFSTYVEGRYYWRTTHNEGYRTFILTHDGDATQNLYDMVHRYHDNCPSLVKPSISASNSKELVFDKLDSGYKIGTAGNKGVGRSSTIQLFHGSEVALWPNADEHATGIIQCIPNSPGSEIFLESTAKGVGNYFHEQWQKAESGASDFIPIFVPWFWQPEYVSELREDFEKTEEEEELQRLYKLTDYQLAWRRLKIVEFTTGGMDGQILFKQEYPCNPIEAFQNTGADSFITPELVMVARKCEVEAMGPLLIGVDPARFGDDRTGIIRRRTRCAYKLETHVKKNTMEIAGIVHNIIINESPTKVFIDVIGLGAGVYDRLVELGHGDIVVAANAANSALNDKLYSNRRAEMWGLMKEWLVEQPTSIPDDDSLHADLCGPNYSFDSNGRLIIEKKESMKKRGIRSPDAADSLALTFFYPVSAFTKNVQKDQVAAKMMSKYRRINQLKESSYGRNR